MRCLASNRWRKAPNGLGVVADPQTWFVSPSNAPLQYSTAPGWGLGAVSDHTADDLIPSSAPISSNGVHLSPAMVGEVGVYSGLMLGRWD
jgi:hypothetical protein